jgi:protoporphyrin/coproporphyrin ferrochelatase
MAAEWANPQIEALLSETAVAVNPSLASAQRDHGHSHGGHGHSHGEHGHSHGGHGHSH